MSFATEPRLVSVHSLYASQMQNENELVSSLFRFLPYVLRIMK